MKYLLDFLAILLMGDGLAKLASPGTHNRFYQFRQAPGGYNRLLQILHDRPTLNQGLAITMILTGTLLSRRMERRL